MKEADRKSAQRFSIGATVIILLIALLCYGFPHTFLADWHHNAKSWTKHLAFVPFLCALGMIYYSSKTAYGEKSGAGYWAMVLLLIVFGIGLSSGFVFDLK